MTLSDALGFAVLSVVFVVTLPRSRALWRGGQAVADTERFYRGFWPYGAAALQAWVRAQVAVLLDFAFMYIAIAGYVFRPLDPPGVSVIPESLRLIGLGGAVVMTAIVIFIILFNVPKRFVIPELRAQEGLAAGWRRSRRRDSKDRVTFRDAD